MKILLKIGGAAIETDAGRHRLATDVKEAYDAGHQLIVVHGGGRQIRSLTDRLQLDERRHEGLRITDGDTAEAVLMVLGGAVNRHLVAAFETALVPAVGLTGADGSSFTVRRETRAAVDLGYVGEIVAVRPNLIETLIAARFVPIIGTVAPLDPHVDGARDHLYNVNADLAAGPLANALDVDLLLFLTDVDGVRDGDGNRIDSLTPIHAEQLRAAGVIHGGMIPKVDAALDAAHAAPRTVVKITAAAGGLADAMRNGTGTTFPSARSASHTGTPPTRRRDGESVSSPHELP